MRTWPKVGTLTIDGTIRLFAFSSEPRGLFPSQPDIQMFDDDTSLSVEIDQREEESNNDENENIFWYESNNVLNTWCFTKWKINGWNRKRSTWEEQLFVYICVSYILSKRLTENEYICVCYKRSILVETGSYFNSIKFVEQTWIIMNLSSSSKTFQR